jgi:RNA polymerase sigma-B factor
MSTIAMTTSTARTDLGAGGSVAEEASQPTAAAARSADRVRAGAVAEALLARLRDLPADHPDRPEVRARLIENYLPLANHLARRYAHRSEPLDDLVQVAAVALIKAVDGFDHVNGAAFTSYAIPMILGELKRHFRDKTWNVRVPRRLQELSLRLRPATGELAQRLGRSPTVAELAAHLDVRDDDVVEALGSGSAYQPASLNAPAYDADGDATAEWSDLLGSTEPGYLRTDNRMALRPLIAALPAREQRIIALRFFDHMTQSQIAAELGISQMHVSRLLSHALAVLRRGMQA